MKMISEFLNADYLSLMDVFGTFAFAVSGSFAAMSKKMDPVGVIILAFVTAIGGGTLRDVLIGNFPVSWLLNSTTILVISFAALISMLGERYIKKIPVTMFVFDAIGLGLFTTYGIELGLQSGFNMAICIALGTITACFGGVIRDVLLNTVPLIFHKEIYAMACVTGGFLYFFLIRFDLNIDLIRVICILFIILIRIIVVKYQLSIPKFYKYRR